MSGNGTKSRVNTAGENYLEAILILEDRKKAVRSVDLAEQMGVSKPSVSRAVHILEKEGLIFFDRGHFLHLTEAGRALRGPCESIPAQVGRCVPLDPEEAATLYRLLYKTLGGISES